MKIFFASILLIYLGILLLFYFAQEFFIFHPSKTAQDFVYKFDADFKEHFFDTENNGRIHAIEFKVDNPKGVVFYLHGNAGSIEDWGWLHRDFSNKGYNFMLMDYRTYGKSSGKLSETNLINDAQHVYDYLTKEFDESKIVVYGRSIGTGIATQIAAKNEPRTLVLESPYFNMRDVVSKVAPFLPVSLILRFPLRSNEHIPQVDCPIHILHGKQDAVVPYQSGFRLFEVSGDKATMYSVENGTHNDLSNFDEYFNMLEKVLD